MSRVSRITQAIQGHAKDLFAKWHMEKICIFRKARRYEHFEYGGVNLVYAREEKQFVWSLTDNWSTDGRPVEWGIEPLLARLADHDLHRRDLAKEYIQNYKKADESKLRNANNNIESFLYDFRSQFKKTFSDVNTSTLKKIDKRRENGN